MRQALRRYLFTFIRERARQRWTVERVGTPRVVAAGTLLEPDALTIGFARRFAGYKRPELIFHDPERLARILNAAERPVQIIFAGKSHPADDIGKHHLQRVYKRALDPLFGGRVAFVDDYDLHVAHFLVQGCDVWLNNPRKPLEASGTSGMKAAINGVPHLSIGDGWWAEGFNGTNGWVIDGGVTGDDHGRGRRRRRRRALPAARRRGRAGVLRARRAPACRTAGWPIVKEAIRTVAPRFSARRMVKEYVERMYAPALGRRAEARSSHEFEGRLRMLSVWCVGAVIAVGPGWSALSAQGAPAKTDRQQPGIQERRGNPGRLHAPTAGTCRRRSPGAARRRRRASSR